jgi:hypothetical protein
MPRASLQPHASSAGLSARVLNACWTNEVPMCDGFSTQRRDIAADSLQMPDERSATQFVIVVRGN